MFKCVVIDDEQPAINVLVNYIKRINELELVGTSTNPVKGVEMVKELGAEVVFLDIQMEEMTGIEAVRLLDNAVQTIFCTAYSEFAVESYDLNAVDYLLKPIPFDRFMRAVKKIRNFPQKDTPDKIIGDYLFVKTEMKGKMIKVLIDDIDYVEAKSNYVSVNIGTKKVLVYSTMNDMERSLSFANFVRIHKSFIIPLSKISSIEGNFVNLWGSSEQIPIGKTYKTDFLNLVNTKLLSNR
ncbi:LytR/AlgR family response regulator transcription factor [Niabella hirudinis]|uniref:LytR/AlgR family response regulator transcription factor n=1 Tax=Niabella hirudinis TaxID=1285929 RepID=UPI003EBF8B48